MQNPAAPAFRIYRACGFDFSEFLSPDAARRRFTLLSAMNSLMESSC
jgi:hypothetical protein